MEKVAEVSMLRRGQWTYGVSTLLYDGGRTLCGIRRAASPELVAWESTQITKPFTKPFDE